MSQLILEVVEGPDAGKRTVVDKPIVVGRDPDAGFVLTDVEVSRQHLRLTPTGDYITVEDLGSANGTFVNHNELHGPARLDAGDELLAGVTVMQVRDRQQVEAKHSAVISVPQGLAMAPRTPTYADPEKITADVQGERGAPELEKYLDVRVRRRAVNAPWLLAVLAVAVVVAYLVTKTNNPANADTTVAGWIYVNANTPTPNKNAVAAIPYATNGFPLVQEAKLYPTDGSGAPNVPPVPNAAGTLAGDHQVLVSPDHTLLFAVNQGSNSIAAFHIDSHTGALTPVAGSPFSADGTAPIGLSYANGILVVANHGIVGPFNPFGAAGPGPSNLVSFKVSATGALTQVSSTAAHGDGLIDSTISPDGTTIITSGFYPEILPGQPFPTFGPQLIKAVTLSSTGQLGSAGQTSLPPAFTAGLSAVLPPTFPKVLYPLVFGEAFNPNPAKKFAYVDATLAGRIAVYNYSNPASLQLASNVMNPGLAACWMAVSNDGRFLYNSDSGSTDITVFSISSDGSTLKFVGKVPLNSKGIPNSVATDPSGRFLDVLGNDSDVDAPPPAGHATADYIDAYKIDPKTGVPSEVAAVRLPVPVADLPYGIATLAKG